MRAAASSAAATAAAAAAAAAAAVAVAAAAAASPATVPRRGCLLLGGELRQWRRLVLAVQRGYVFGSCWCYKLHHLPLRSEQWRWVLRLPFTKLLQCWLL